MGFPMNNDLEEFLDQSGTDVPSDPTLTCIHCGAHIALPQHFMLLESTDSNPYPGVDKCRPVCCPCWAARMKEPCDHGPLRGPSGMDDELWDMLGDGRVTHGDL